uniref:F-box domain-containing protein n=1 Tax=Leersia perrieri TaxID=77586 RepID=A0A0D9WDC5_9ORYZ
MFFIFHDRYDNDQKIMSYGVDSGKICLRPPTARGRGILRRRRRRRISPTVIYDYERLTHHFIRVPGTEEPSPSLNESPSLSFLPKCESIDLLGSCNGLLLCKKFDAGMTFNYVVCNPATKKWVALPDSIKHERTVRPYLGFDPVVSSHFHVFELVEETVDYDNGEFEEVDSDGNDDNVLEFYCNARVLGLRVYSSKTGAWTDVMDSGKNSVFFNGMLHFLAMESSVVTVVDVEGKNWRTIPLPHIEGSHPPSYDRVGFIDLSQGLLCFVCTDNYDGNNLSVWVLDDYNSEQWTLHHTISSTHIFGRSRRCPDLRHDYTLLTIKEGMMFFIFYDRDPPSIWLVSYEMGSGEVCFLHNFGHYFPMPCLPYLPLFLESIADGRTVSNQRPRRTAPPPPSQGEEEEMIGDDDLLVEILSRVPYKCLVRSKLVSRRWRRVISHRDHRRRLPRYHLDNTIAGFFYTDYHIERYDRQWMVHRLKAVTSAEPPPLVDPSFSFLPKCELLYLLGSCNGLLLLRCWKLNERKKFRTFNYVVCNPATKKFVVLPDSTWSRTIRPYLGFDPAVSFHFHVFELVQELVDYEEGDSELDSDGDEHVLGLRVYSSETGVWTDVMDSGWGININIQENNSKGVYFNGMLHLPAKESVVAVVDLEGKNWRTIPLPHKDGSPLYGAHPPCASHPEGFIDLSQGLLHFVSTDKYDARKISVWVLGDYNSGQWTLQHTASSSHLFGRRRRNLYFGYEYTLVLIHERKMFFIFSDRDQCDSKLMSYGMDSGEPNELHVFEFIEDGAMDVDGNFDQDNYGLHVIGVEIYSSETGAWIHRDNGWGYNIVINGNSNSVFLNSVLHLVTLKYVVAAVGVEGNTWRIIPMPQSEVEPFYGIGEGFIDLSRGCLYFIITMHAKYQYGLLRTTAVKSGLLFGRDYEVITVHPERNTIFIVGPDRRVLISYEMDSREVHFICKLGPAMAEEGASQEGIRSAESVLTDDLLVEVLSRLPFKSLCRSRCVSRRWHRVISNPDHRRPLHLTATLAGFLHSDPKSFISITGEEGSPFVLDPSLPFLPMCDVVEFVGTCNGLILCRCWGLTFPGKFEYLVVNPITEKWVKLCGWAERTRPVFLGFDPAVSIHFHVFEFLEDCDGYIIGVEIYSSKMKAWNPQDIGWDYGITTFDISNSKFFNNMLHLVAMEDVVGAVDVEGTTWRTIPKPQSDQGPLYGIGKGFIEFAQGCEVSVWVLEDYSRNQWTWRHTVSHLHLFGIERLRFGRDYKVVSIHPERNIIYLAVAPRNAHPDHRRLLPRYHLDSALAGFFHSKIFFNVTGEGRPFCDDVNFLDGCNGLLLCRQLRRSGPRAHRFDYLVANPATEQFVICPRSGRSHDNMQNVSPSHFHVFELVENGNWEIYSSKIGVWIHKDHGWGHRIKIYDYSNSVFFNNVLHFIATENVVAAVDAEGDTWRTIPIPQTEEPFYATGGFIDLSQDCLYYVNANDRAPHKVSVWALEDYSSKNWTLKHTVSHVYLFGTVLSGYHYKVLLSGYHYKVLLIHPERNTIYFVLPRDGKVMSYVMDSREVHFICKLECLSLPMAERASRRKEWIPPAEKLTDDLLVEILSRVPYKSLIRSKLVSPRWRRVISDPNHRNRLPRYHLDTTLAGFFNSESFINVRGEGRPLFDPSFPFLPKCDNLNILDSCNDLLLCRCERSTHPWRFEFDYLVVNPATEKWVALPDSGWSDRSQTAYLGFDPVVSSSHFHVFKFVEDRDEDDDWNVHHVDYGLYVEGAQIYSSKTGMWTRRDNDWGYTNHHFKSVFFNSMLHLITKEYVVAAVDVEGNTWRTIPMPQSLSELKPFYGHNSEGFINLARGCLYFVHTNRYERHNLSVWVLEDYNSGEWILKHTVSHLHLFGTEIILFGLHYKVVSIDPERNAIFSVLPQDRKVISYEMDSREVHFICELGSMAEGASRREGIPPMEKLSDDLLVDILSRVPYKSLCRSKCVSPRWRRVISHRDHRRLLPRYHLDADIAGFFHSESFFNLTAEGPPLVDPSLPFLPSYNDVEVVDTCNGLLLCRSGGSQIAGDTITW